MSLGSLFRSSHAHNLFRMPIPLYPRASLSTYTTARTNIQPATTLLARRGIIPLTENTTVRFRITRFPPCNRSLRQFSNSTSQVARVRYRRFGDAYNDGQGGFGGYSEPLFARLLRKARAYHFVIAGLVIEGIYTYNTDVVEVFAFFSFLPLLLRLCSQAGMAN